MKTFVVALTHLGDEIEMFKLEGEREVDVINLALNKFYFKDQTHKYENQFSNLDTKNIKDHLYDNDIFLGIMEI